VSFRVFEVEGVTIPPHPILHSMTSTRRIAACWYVYGYLREVVLIYPVYAIMMGEHGISPLQLSVLFIVWSASAMVFEVPSGVLADRYSRRGLLIAAGAFKGSAFIVWWLAPDFLGYLVGFVVWGLGSSLTSGTGESFLFDSLKARRDEAAFPRIYGRGMAANSIGVATALAGGGYLAEFGYPWPLALSIAAPWLASLVVAFAFVEPPRSGATQHTQFRTTLSAGIAEVRASPVVRRIVLITATLVTAYMVVDEYIGPFLKETPKLSLGMVGIVYAAAYATRTLGMEVAHRLPFRSLRAIAVLFAIGAVGLAATAAATGLWLIITIGSCFATVAAAQVLLQTHLQNEIEGSARATVTSFVKVAEYAGELLFYVYIGGIAQLWSFQVAVAAVAALTFVLAIVLATIAPAQGR
jgi:predicted MFS family arabinose efflux permease